MKKTIGGLVLTGLLAFGVATNAHAAVNFDSVSGSGFVGKGDVQQVFGWNNAAAQTNLPNVKFNTVTTETYRVTEEFYTLQEEILRDENGNIVKIDKKPVKIKVVNDHPLTKISTQSLNGNIAFDLRKATQINGINLTGKAGEPVITGDAIPALGTVTVDRQNERNSNPNQILDGVQYPTDSVVTEVTPLSSDSMLYVNYNGVSIAMPNTPVDPIVVQ